MPRLVSIQSLVACVSLLVAAGCGTDTQSGESSGSLRLNLELAGGGQIDEVSFVIMGNGIPPIADTIDTSPLGATASVEVQDIPVGEEDYLIEMMATSVDGDTICEGSAPFNVRAGELTELAVVLMCKPGERFGAVDADGSFNICEELPRIVVSVSPLQTPVGSTINVSAQPVDAEGDSLSYLWTGTGGSFADPTAASTTYTCGALGNQTITLEVTDDEGCDETWTVNITCVGDAGECTNARDTGVYDTVEYTNQNGNFNGTEAVSEIAADCVFGTAPNLISNGCGSETGIVLGSPTPENRAALAACVEQCTADQGVDLSADCLGCYGDNVTCNVASCAAPCASNANAPACINCRCENGCFPDFYACSGLPDGGECDGTGGTGGNGCRQTCGLGNSVEPAWANDQEVLNCTVMGIGIGFEWNLLGQVAGGGPPVIGENTYDLQLEAIISEGTANLILALADSATILGTTGTVVPTAGTTDTNTADIDLLNTPCEVCFVRDQEVRVPLPVVQDTWNLNDGTTQSLSLPDVTIEIDAAGLTLLLSTLSPDPACVWNTIPPEIDFTVPQ